jgi:multidrug efflux pump subunit AcrA (membrane-fusion protein)
MTTRAVIHAQKVADGLSIPLHAVFTEQKNHFCYVSDPTGYEKRMIALGASNEQWAEVISGLQEGDSVCLINPFVKDAE